MVVRRSCSSNLFPMMFGDWLRSRVSFWCFCAPQISMSRYGNAFVGTACRATVVGIPKEGLAVVDHQLVFYTAAANLLGRKPKRSSLGSGLAQLVLR